MHHSPTALDRAPTDRPQSDQFSDGVLFRTSRSRLGLLISGIAVVAAVVTAIYAVSLGSPRSSASNAATTTPSPGGIASGIDPPRSVAPSTTSRFETPLPSEPPPTVELPADSDSLAALAHDSRETATMVHDLLLGLGRTDLPPGASAAQRSDLLTRLALEAGKAKSIPQGKALAGALDKYAAVVRQVVGSNTVSTAVGIATTQADAAWADAVTTIGRAASMMIDTHLPPLGQPAGAVVPPRPR